MPEAANPLSLSPAASPQGRDVVSESARGNIAFSPDLGSYLRMFSQPGPRYVLGLVPLLLIAALLLALGEPAPKQALPPTVGTLRDKVDHAAIGSGADVAPPAGLNGPSGAHNRVLAARETELPGAPWRASSMARSPAADPTLPAAPIISRDGILLYSAARVENVRDLARQFLAQSSLMTVSELESAIRQANGLGSNEPLRPGRQIIVPSLESLPMAESPRLAPRDAEFRAIYLTGSMASSERGIQMIRRWKQAGGNAIVFDIKDSDGILSIPFGHRFAPGNRHHAISNLPKFVRFLHSLGMHTIARIALFRDERLVRAWPQLAVRSRSTAEPWRENGKLVWTDPSHPDVQEYDLALATAVARAGADEIQFDYVRFPAEGNQTDAAFAFERLHPGWKRSDVITDFVSRAYAALRPLGVLVSLDVFGVVAWQRPVDLAHTGQDIVALARHCDVLSPMIYPSHFFGMDGYAKPGDAPAHFISESMERFRKITDGSGVVLRPWLQAFAWRTRTYSTDYILRQVSIARDQGGIGFLFWNAHNDYSRPFAAMPTMVAQPQRFLGVNSNLRAAAEDVHAPSAAH